MPRLQYLHCKLGTQPAQAHIHGRDALETGKRVRIKERDGDKWHSVLVTRVDRNEDGAVMYFMADR